MGSTLGVVVPLPAVPVERRILLDWVSADSTWFYIVWRGSRDDDVFHHLGCASSCGCRSHAFSTLGRAGSRFVGDEIRVAQSVLLQIPGNRSGVRAAASSAVDMASPPLGAELLVSSTGIGVGIVAQGLVNSTTSGLLAERATMDDDRSNFSIAER